LSNGKCDRDRSDAKNDSFLKNYRGREELVRTGCRYSWLREKRELQYRCLVGKMMMGQLGMMAMFGYTIQPARGQERESKILL